MKPLRHVPPYDSDLFERLQHEKILANRQPLLDRRKRAGGHARGQHRRLRQSRGVHRNVGDDVGPLKPADERRMVRSAPATGGALVYHAAAASDRTGSRTPKAIVVR